jgi:hypothetical protein
MKFLELLNELKDESHINPSGPIEGKYWVNVRTRTVIKVHEDQHLHHSGDVMIYPENYGVEIKTGKDPYTTYYDSRLNYHMTQAGWVRVVIDAEDRKVDLEAANDTAAAKALKILHNGMEFEPETVDIDIRFSPNASGLKSMTIQGKQIKYFIKTGKISKSSTVKFKEARR